MKAFFRQTLLLFPILLAIVSCGGGTPIPPATGLLYVLEKVNKAIYVYDNIDTINGALDPVRTISGSTNTLIDNPTAIAVDTRRDILYVAETTGEQVLAFIPASTTDGDVSPRKTYPGLAKSDCLFYDLKNDTLYATDTVNLAVQVWDKISTIPNQTPPDRKIGLGYVPSSIYVDAQRDLLYVGDPSTASVKIYLNSSTLGSSSATPNATIQDGTLPFVDVNSIALNVDNNYLFVAESFNPSVEIFTDASTLTGTVPADREVTGDTTTMTTDMNQAIFQENVLYVQTSRTQVGIWDSANSVAGNVGPTRSITVNPAQQILGIAVDLAH